MCLQPMSLLSVRHRTPLLAWHPEGLLEDVAGESVWKGVRPPYLHPDASHQERRRHSYYRAFREAIH